MRLRRRLVLMAPAAALAIGLVGCGSAPPVVQAPPTAASAPPPATYVSSLRPPTQQETSYLSVLASFGMDTEGEAGDTLRLTSQRICSLKDVGMPEQEIMRDLQRDGWTTQEASWMDGAADARYCRATAG